LERIYRTKLLSEQQNAQCETKPLSIRHLQDGFDSNCQVIAVAPYLNGALQPTIE
jgi:hypothetical protein